MRITKMKKREDLKSRLLYDWNTTTTYSNLTRAKMEQSMFNADGGKIKSSKLVL